MILKGVWFIIAGVFLLGHTQALAEPYLRVCKDGVVYYHFTSRKPTPPGQAPKQSPKPRRAAKVIVPSPRHKLPLSSVKEPGRVDYKVKAAAVSPLDHPTMMPPIPGKAEELPFVKPSDAKKMILAGTDHVINLLTKVGCRQPLALPEYAGLQPVGRRTPVPAGPAPQLVVPEGWLNLLKHAQEKPAELARVGSSFYRFPVGGPFSFRDTWDESRSGGRQHRAVDIFAPEGSEVYAITTGVIGTLATLPNAGITLFLQGQDGRGYGYMHLQGYAAGLVEGKAVRAGEVIGYVGRTGIQSSAAHLHLQVYADHRLCKDELLNPYGFLVQLCHGIGVTDLYQHKLARLEAPEIGVKGIRVYRRPSSAAVRRRVGQLSVQDPTILVINNF
jgi:hypothetical protein